MSLTFGTDAWAQALVATINASSEYRNAAAKWGDGFNGNVLLVFDADATQASTHALLVELSKGVCRRARTWSDSASSPRCRRRSGARFASDWKTSAG